MCQIRVDLAETFSLKKIICQVAQLALPVPAEMTVTPIWHSHHRMYWSIRRYMVAMFQKFISFNVAQCVKKEWIWLKHFHWKHLWVKAGQKNYPWQHLSQETVPKQHTPSDRSSQTHFQSNQASVEILFRPMHIWWSKFLFSWKNLFQQKPLWHQFGTAITGCVDQLGGTW